MEGEGRGGGASRRTIYLFFSFFLCSFSGITSIIEDIHQWRKEAGLCEHIYEVFFAWLFFSFFAYPFNQQNFSFGVAFSEEGMENGNGDGDGEGQNLRYRKGLKLKSKVKWKLRKFKFKFSRALVWAVRRGW